jgi:LemA protein
MKGALIALVVVAVFAVVAISGVLLRDYNQLETERSDIEARWARLKKDMTDRGDIVTEILRRAKGHPIGDSPIVNDLAKAHDALVSARTREEQMAANTRLSAALASLQRQDPRFMSDQALRDRLADAEQKIADDRREYNEAIQKYNTDLQLSPKNFSASLFRFQRYNAYFPTTNDETRPR